MAQYSWITCPPFIRTQIETFCQQTSAVLRDDLVGIYLHGSLAMGCFNPELSDIDLLVVTQQLLSVEIKRQMIEQLLQISHAPCPIEISFLILSEIHPFEHPLLYDLHYSETWRDQKRREIEDGTWQHWNKERRRDPDLAAHLMITRHRGVTLYGKSPSKILPPVPGEDYARSILGDYRDAREGRMSNPMYFVLNGCRVAAYLSKGYVYSKDEGGVYGLAMFPPEFHELISQALERYRGSGLAKSFDGHKLTCFAGFLDQLILSQGYKEDE